MIESLFMAGDVDALAIFALSTSALGRAAMTSIHIFKSYVFLVLIRFQSWPIMPIFLRPMFLRALGLKIGPRARIAHGVFFGSNKVTMERDVGINIGCVIDGSEHVYFGEGVRLGMFVKIITGSHTKQNSVFRRDLKESIKRPVRIERGCWLQTDVKVNPGVTIAEGCVINVSAVVTKDTDANGDYYGIPAVRRATMSTDDDG
jgi:maltose O-acetyltransferase